MLNTRYKLDTRIEPPNTIGLVDSRTGKYYFISGQNRQENLALAKKICEILNKEDTACN